MTPASTQRLSSGEQEESRALDRIEDLKVIADPTYVAFNALMFRAAMLGERVLPEGLGIHLLGDLERK